MTVLNKQFIFRLSLLICLPFLTNLHVLDLTHAQLIPAASKPKGLKNQEAALKLAELIVKVYELQRADEASDQVKFLIREALDEQSRAGFNPIDLWGILPKQKPRETAQLVSKLWKNLKKKSSKPKLIRKSNGRTIGPMNHEHLQLFLNQLFVSETIYLENLLQRQ